MDAHQIKTAPDPYSLFHIAQGYTVGDLVLLSGQAAIDSEGNIIGDGDIDAQIEQTMINIGKLLDVAGSSFSQIVKVTIYLTDMGYFPKILELRQRWFTPPYPADTIVEVRSLALPELMIEIEVTAMREGVVVAA